MSTDDGGGYDAADFRSSVFIKKDTLRKEGPQQLVIKAVEKGEGIARNGKPPKAVLTLTFENDTKFSLSANVNLDRVVNQYGLQTIGWLGKAIELYYSPDVRGPNGEEGGIRVRFGDQPRPTVAAPNFTAALQTPNVSAATNRFVDGLDAKGDGHDSAF